MTEAHHELSEHPKARPGVRTEDRHSSATSSSHPQPPNRGVSQKATSISPYSRVTPQVPPLQPAALRNQFPQNTWEGRLRKVKAWETTRSRSTESGHTASEHVFWKCLDMGEEVQLLMPLDC